MRNEWKNGGGRTLGRRLRGLLAALLAGLCLFAGMSPAVASGVELAGRTIDSETTELDLSGAPVDKPALMRALGELPALTSVDLRGSGLDAWALETLMERYPAVRFIADIELFGQRFSTADTALDLSGCRDIDPDRLMDALRLMPALERLDLSGCALSYTRMRELAEAYPEILFIWELELLDGLSIRSDTESVDLRGMTVEDVEAFTERLSLCRGLRYADMCGCGLTDEQMEALRTRFPAIQFVWIVHVGAWDLRTDAKGFSMGLRKDHEGVSFVGEGFSCYRNITKETIAPLRYCTELEALDMGHAFGLTDISVVQYLTKLRFLVITDTNVADIEAVAKLENLEFFEMFITRHKEERRLQYVDISPVLQLKKLRQYNCSQLPQPDIELLKQLTWLERLWVIKCGFTEEQLAELQAALPDTWILAEGKQGGTNWRYKNPMYFEMQDLFGLQYAWQTPD